MSVPFTAADVVAWTGARIVRGSSAVVFAGTGIDTRSLGPGVLFVAIRGERHDAHDFLADAVARGASGLLVETGRAIPGGLAEAVCVLETDDTIRALGAIGAGHRARFEGPVVAITGSNGKTTTKEMTASILGLRSPCLKTPGNWNNQFGLPLTLLLREASHRSIVVEIGMNHRGEIAPLVAIARPTVGLITNVGTAHIENLGSQDEIAAEKGELVAGLDAGAVAVLNADDPRVLAQRGRTRAKIVTFAEHARADVRAEQVRAAGESGFAFDLVAPQGRMAIEVPGLAATTVTNSLAAAAVALAAGVPLDDVAEGLARHRNVGGRMEEIRLARGIRVINDTYNANPQSMAVALRSLAELKGAGRGLAVLGDMGELGETAAPEHRATGRLVAELGIDWLVVVGRLARETAAGAVEAGMDPGRGRVAGDHASASAEVERILGTNDWVLVKGSRSSRMERVVEALASGAVGG